MDALLRELEGVRGEHAAFDNEMTRLRRRREEVEEAEVEEAARALARRPPEAAALEGTAREVEARADALLGQVGTLFEVLGGTGVARLGQGEAVDDGLRGGLRDLWADLVLAEKECDLLYTQASLRVRLDATVAGGGSDVRTSERGRDAAICLRATLERIANERCFCEAMGVSVPAKHVAKGSLSSVPAHHIADSSGGEEWDEPVFCKDSESEEEACVETGYGDIVPTLPTGVASSAATTPKLNSAEMLVAMSSRAAGAAHNVSAMAFANAADVDTPRKRRASALGGTTGRQRLKKKLGRKRTRTPVQLSP